MSDDPRESAAVENAREQPYAGDVLSPFAGLPDQTPERWAELERDYLRRLDQEWANAEREYHGG